MSKEPQSHIMVHLTSAQCLPHKESLSIFRDRNCYLLYLVCQNATDFQPLKIPAIRPTVMLPANGVDKSYKPIVLLPDVGP